MIRRLLIGILGLWVLQPAHGVIETYEFENEDQQLRYQVFVEELRCPKCQNQNLSGSNSPIAADLRRELHRLLSEGKSDDEIVDFMVTRYGDFVLYRPPVNRHTAVLWSFPVVVLALGLLVVVLLIRRRKRAAPEDDVAAVHREAQELLNNYDEDGRQ